MNLSTTIIKHAKIFDKANKPTQYDVTGYMIVYGTRVLYD